MFLDMQIIRVKTVLFRQLENRYLQKILFYHRVSLFSQRFPLIKHVVFKEFSGTCFSVSQIRFCCFVCLIRENT